MRLLIVTQAVDRDDPILGFFHRWIEEFAKRCEIVHVVCLREGRHALPKHVTVHSLGKERGASRAAYLWRFYRNLFALRHEYDAVFVHMNPEYVVLGGALWRLMGKRIVLWRNHKMPSLIAQIGAMCADTVCFTSPAAYVARFKNATQMPIGIDTAQFIPGDEDRAGVLSIGRLDPVKRNEVLLEALELLERDGVRVSTDIYGEATAGHEAYADELQRRFAHLKSVRFHGSVPHDQTPQVYASHAIYVNLTPSGSFDKTIGEAAACECILVVANQAVESIVPTRLFVRDANAREVAAALVAAMNLPGKERERTIREGRAFVEHEHSLGLLVKRVLARCT